MTPLAAVAERRLAEERAEAAEAERNRLVEEVERLRADESNPEAPG